MLREPIIVIRGRSGVSEEAILVVIYGFGSGSSGRVGYYEREEFSVRDYGAHYSIDITNETSLYVAPP